MVGPRVKHCEPANRELKQWELEIFIPVGLTTPHLIREPRGIRINVAKDIVSMSLRNHVMVEEGSFVEMQLLITAQNYALIDANS